MVKEALSFWRQFINQTSDIRTGKPTQRIFQHFSEPGVLLGLLTIIVGMVIWNWQLLLAVVVGIGIMIFSYSMQQWNWQLRWLEIRKLMSSTNNRFAYSVVAGGMATVITYMTLAIWVDSPSHWLAAGAIFQGLGTLLTLILLVWQIFSFQGNEEENYVENLLVKLTEKDPLKRFMGMRQLNMLINRKQIDKAIQQDIIDCLQLLLSQEKEVMIREAALECLQNLDGLQLIKPNQTKVFIPVSAKAKQKVIAD
ncbi:MAG: armadillo-type fold-containing protein [Cuspidothrix sp.]